MVCISKDFSKWLSKYTVWGVIKVFGRRRGTAKKNEEVNKAVKRRIR